MLNREKENKEKCELVYENKQLKFQNRILRELLKKHSIDIPEEIDEYAFIETIGKEAYIYEELSFIKKQIRITNELFIKLFMK